MSGSGSNGKGEKDRADAVQANQEEGEIDDDVVPATTDTPERPYTLAIDIGGTGL